ncbi:hypothetical protein [Pyxidicoccus trucidator]|uniref:hypothetical protein n=1 Tax=Pyxidicoccus trucidator TaxID=2709662 RepID=UPI0013DD5240|nr:hypothetical protein [Pyxidicoccus trucidator]
MRAVVREVAVLALCLSGCRARPAATAPDAGSAAVPPARSALERPVGPVTTPPDPGPASTPAPAHATEAPALTVGACDEVWRAAQVDVAFKEEPEDAVGQRTGPRLERRFTVTRQLRGAYRYKDQWASVLEYETAEVRGGVSYSLTVPDVLADLKGRTVAWASHREPAGCLSSEGEEPVLLAVDTLRDEKGKMLLLTVPSAPTEPGGDVLLPAGLVPELRVRWEEAGCEAGQGARTRGVRLRFEDARARGTAPRFVAASVGETVPLTLGGTRYEVRVVRARVDTSGRCGQAVFTLFREGLREPRAAE